MKKFRLDPKFKPDPKDLIIVLLGPTGSGKTNFINTVTGNTEEAIPSPLGSATQDVTTYTIPYHDLRLVLIDTPGLDNTRKPDREILRSTANWLTKKYPNGETLRLTGVIYFHRITDNHMSGSAYKNLQMFGRLCGKVPLCRARLLTTMWDTFKGHPTLMAKAEDREKDLMDGFWRPLIVEGAVAKRFDNNSKSAMRIVDELIAMEVAKDALLIQEELVKHQKRLDETEAGKLVDPHFQRLLAEQRQKLKELIDEANLQNDAALAKSLQEEYDQINTLVQFRAFEDRKDTEAPHPKRGTMWLFGGIGGKLWNTPFNILLFGEAGVGKSSVINLIAGENLAPVSSDAWGCTLESQQYTFKVAKRTLNIWDTVGLGEPSFSTTEVYLSAIEKTHQLIRQIEAKGGLDLLLFCIPGSRITNTMQPNYTLFFEVLCEEQIPISIVVTHLEREKNLMEDWWLRNREYINTTNLKFSGHACVTGLAKNPRQAGEGRSALESLLLSFDSRRRHPMPPASDWFDGFLARLFITPLLRSLKVDLTQKELEQQLRSRCNMESENARRLAENLIRIRSQDR